MIEHRVRGGDVKGRVGKRQRPIGLDAGIGHLREGIAECYTGLRLEPFSSNLFLPLDGGGDE
jgi:hypothetical protein